MFGWLGENTPQRGKMYKINWKVIKKHNMNWEESAIYWYGVADKLNEQLKSQSGRKAL